MNDQRKLDKFELNDKLSSLIQDMKNSKPDDRSETDRYYAVVITDLEKAYAYFFTYVMEKYP